MSPFKNPPRLMPFDEVESNNTDDEEAAGDEVALLLDHSCSLLNESVSAPNDKGSAITEPPLN